MLLAIAGGSYVFDVRTDFKYLMFPRSGAIITCFSILLPLIRFRYAEIADGIDSVTDDLLRHYRMMNATERRQRRFLQISKFSSLTTAVVGTLIWAFGDFAKAGFP